MIDHPFSPFVDLDVDQMRELAGRGITLNFTYDELSPLLGVDPAKMYAAIRAIGPQYCTLSSDAGEPLFRTRSSACGSSVVSWKPSG